MDKKAAIEIMKNHSLLVPFFYFGKKYIYNIYKRKTLVAPEYPVEIWIENTNYCNAKCIMCPREKLTRKQGVMDLGLYEKLINEISQFKGSVKRVHMHNFGEPLLDKDLIWRIKLAKKLGIKHTYFVTNASLLNKEMSLQLIESGLDEFKISFYGTDEKTYNNVMVGLDFNHVFENMIFFFKLRKKAKNRSPKVVIQYIPMRENEGNIDTFIEKTSPLIDESIGDRLNIFSLHNYTDGRQYLKSDQVTGICPFPWNTMVVLNDGKVVLCSPDYNGLNIIGDANKNSIYDIWNSDAYNKVRQDFKRLNYSGYYLCEKCTVTT